MFFVLEKLQVINWTSNTIFIETAVYYLDEGNCEF